MRPTHLQFRSPKERTPDSYDVNVTPDGRVLNFPTTKGSERGTSLPLERRFRYYDDQFKKTGFMIGPGSYNLENLNIERSKLTKGIIYKPYHNNRDASNNAYLMVGDSLVYDGMLKNRQAKSSDIEDRIDVRLSLQNRQSLTPKDRSTTVSYTQSTGDEVSQSKPSPLGQSFFESGSPWKYLQDSTPKSLHKPKRSKQRISRRADSSNMIKKMLSDRFLI